MARASVAVVSGVTGEVGVAVTRLLWDRGVRILGFYGRSQAKARTLAREAEKRGSSILLANVNLRDPARARQRIGRIIRSLSADWKSVDTFIGLAGFPARGVWQGAFENHRPDTFEAVYRVDTLSHAWFAQALAPALKRRRGSIVLMSSAAGLIGDELGIPFALAKAANVALVKSLARILAPRVTVNGVAPGALETSWLRELTAAQRRKARSAALLERFGKPEEIAATIVELAVGPNRFQTGQVLVLDGGVAL